ncbi:MAG: LuxR C-terminal-related transcriptional regulator [Rhizobium sp.]|nr:LuxR C-terminal-related transcriptional regulator [Rhizobium sp.]
MKFSEDDVEDLSDLIGLIYETVLDSGKWSVVLERVCRFVGASASRIYWRDATSAQAETIYSWGFDPKFLDIYRRGYVSLNPLYPASIFINPGEIFSSQDLVPSHEFQTSRFFKEWVAPQGFFDAAIFNIQRYQASAAAFTVISGRDYGAVDDALRYRLKLLAPHLQRAVIIGRELGKRNLQAQSLQGALDQIDTGVFILDEAGRGLWSNHAGTEMLTKGDLVRATGPRISLASAEANHALRAGLSGSPVQPDPVALREPALIKMVDAEGTAWTGCLMRLPEHSATQTAFQQVRPSAQAALFIRPAEVVPTSGIEKCARRYGLTPAEVRVLHAVLEIDRISDIADGLGISANTVKKHLSALFDKTGVSRRAALVKTVMAAAHSS